MSKKNVTPYFSHDANARNDSKIIELRQQMGAEGYAIYFMIVEILRIEPDYKYERNYHALAFDIRVDPKKVKSVVEDFGLFKFTEDKKYIYSDSLTERMDYMKSVQDKKVEKAKKAANARWNKEKRKSSEKKHKRNRRNAHERPIKGNETSNNTNETYKNGVETKENDVVKKTEDKNIMRSHQKTMLEHAKGYAQALKNDASSIKKNANKIILNKIKQNNIKQKKRTKKINTIRDPEGERIVNALRNFSLSPDDPPSIDPRFVLYSQASSLIREWNKLPTPVEEIKNSKKNRFRLYRSLDRYGYLNLHRAIRKIPESKFLTGRVSDFVILFNYFTMPEIPGRILDNEYRSDDLVSEYQKNRLTAKGVNIAEWAKEFKRSASEDYPNLFS